MATKKITKSEALQMFIDSTDFPEFIVQIQFEKDFKEFLSINSNRFYVETRNRINIINTDVDESLNYTKKLIRDKSITNITVVTHPVTKQKCFQIINPQTEEAPDYSDNNGEYVDVNNSYDIGSFLKFGFIFLIIFILFSLFLMSDAGRTIRLILATKIGELAILIFLIALITGIVSSVVRPIGDLVFSIFKIEGSFIGISLGGIAIGLQCISTFFRTTEVNFLIVGVIFFLAGIGLFSSKKT